MHAVLVTIVFERQAKAAGIDDAKVDDMIVHLAANPRAGALMMKGADMEKGGQ